MKILMMEWNSFGNEDIIPGFRELGHTVKTIPFSKSEPDHNEKIENDIIKEILDFQPDFVFSFNYFPIISLACKKTDMKYVSWVYDNPTVLLYSYTVIYSGNYIFIFDKELYLEFHKAGITTTYYMPLAANTDRLQAMENSKDLELFYKSKWKNQADIAFIGSLYTEKHQFYQRLEGISPYTRGYLEGIMAVATHEFLFAQYVINRQITATERTEILTTIGQKYNFDLYTPDEKLTLPGCINHGKVDYYDNPAFLKFFKMYNDKYP